jgi:hypothetical protein
VLDLLVAARAKRKGQTQCQRLPHEWGLGKEITEAKSYPRRNSVERRLRTQDLVTRRASTHQLHHQLLVQTDFWKCEDPLKNPVEARPDDLL